MERLHASSPENPQFAREKALMGLVVTALEHAVNMEGKAMHDPLTGVLNRNGFDKFVEEHGMPKALLVIDGDGTKRINDVLGHNRGDAFIQDTAKIAINSVRARDAVVRTGGDEYMIALYTDEDSQKNEDPVDMLVSVGGRLKSNMCALLNDPRNADLQENDVRFGISTGGAIWEEGMSLEELIQVADDAMYLDKEHGRKEAFRRSGTQPRNLRVVSSAAC